MWQLAANAALSFLSASSEGEANRKRIIEEGIARNNAVVKANLANTLRTGYRAGLLNMQKGLLKKQTAQRGFDTTAAAQEALGAVTANQAASGTIGASVDAVSQDIQMKMGEALAQNRDAYEIDLLNWNTQLGELLFEAKQATQDMAQVDLPSDSDIFGNALMSAAVSAGTMYANSKMSLGPGSSGGGFAIPERLTGRHAGPI